MSNWIKCPKCGKEIGASLSTCPICGYSLKSEEHPESEYIQIKKVSINRISKILGYTYLILGFIGSIVFANDIGKLMSSSYYGRDWVVTISVFIGCLISVLTVSIILIGIGIILEKLDQLQKHK